jgi:glutathione S-transferase
MMELWHCKDSRSLRALWALEELGLPYQLHLLRFPPRLHAPEFLAVNPLGTVPYLIDGVVRMTESCAIVHYLCEGTDLAVPRGAPGHTDWLNWMYQGDATLTFPQTLVLRYSRLEAPERRQPQVAEDYTHWFHARLKMVNARLEQAEWLAADRFTGADIAAGYALYLAQVLGLAEGLKPQTRAYLDRLTARPAFQRANAFGQPLKV